MPRQPQTPWEKLLRQAQQQGSLDASENVRYPKLMPELLEALGVKTKLHPGQLATLKSVYRAGFSLGGDWA